jgi:hypothetical protein
MIARCDDVDAGRKNFGGGVLGDAGAAGGVFSIRDAEVNVVALAKFGHEFADSFAAGFADDVSYEKNVQGGEISGSGAGEARGGVMDFDFRECALRGDEVAA